MSSRLRFTHNRPANTDNHYVVGSGIGSKSRFVRSALRRRSSNNSQGKPCCSSKNKIPENKSCLNGMVWKECGSACTPTCDNPTPICTKQCVAGCECPQGHVLDGGNCVDVNTCNQSLGIEQPEVSCSVYGVSGNYIKDSSNVLTKYCCKTIASDSSGCTSGSTDDVCHDTTSDNSGSEKCLFDRFWDSDCSSSPQPPPSAFHNPPDCNLDWLDLTNKDLAQKMANTTLAADNSAAIFIPQSCIQDYSKLDSNPAKNLNNIANNTYSSGHPGCKNFKCSKVNKCVNGMCEGDDGSFARVCYSSNDCQTCSLEDVAKAWQHAGMNPNLCPFALGIVAGEGMAASGESSTPINFWQGYTTNGLFQCDTCRQKEYNVDGVDCTSKIPPNVSTKKQPKRAYYIGDKCDIDITNNACIQAFSSVQNILAPFSIKGQFSSDKRTPDGDQFIRNSFGQPSGVDGAGWCYPNQYASKFTDVVITEKIPHIGPFCQQGIFATCKAFGESNFFPRDASFGACVVRKTLSDSNTWVIRGGKWNGGSDDGNFPGYYLDKVYNNSTIKAFEKTIGICKKAYGLN